MARFIDQEHDISVPFRFDGDPLRALGLVIVRQSKISRDAKFLVTASERKELEEQAWRDGKILIAGDPTVEFRSIPFEIIDG